MFVIPAVPSAQLTTSALILRLPSLHPCMFVFPAETNFPSAGFLLDYPTSLLQCVPIRTLLPLLHLLLSPSAFPSSSLFPAATLLPFLRAGSPLSWSRYPTHPQSTFDVPFPVPTLKLFFFRFNSLSVLIAVGAHLLGFTLYSDVWMGPPYRLCLLP